MQDLRQLENEILAQGRVAGQALELLRKKLHSTDGTVGRTEADFLVVLHKRVEHVSPAFEQFFYQTIKGHILVNGRINAEMVAWLRQLLFTDGTIKDEKRKLLHELKGEATHIAPEFEAAPSVQEALGRGADAVHHKPLNVSELLQTLDRLAK